MLHNKQAAEKNNFYWDHISETERETIFMDGKLQQINLLTCNIFIVKCKGQWIFYGQ